MRLTHLLTLILIAAAAQPATAGERIERVWIPAQYQTETKSEYIPARYETVSRQRWIEPRYKIVNKRVWVPARYTQVPVRSVVHPRPT